MKKMIAGIALAVAVSVSAAHSAVWVSANNTTVGPFGTYGTSLLFIDPATDYVWALSDPLSDAPTLTPILMGNVQTFYTTTNCTGTAYFALLPADVINFTRQAGIDGLAYVGGAVYNVNAQIQSTWYGSCVSQAPIPSNYLMAAIVGPVTPPTIPAGPYRIVAR